MPTQHRDLGATLFALVLMALGLYVLSAGELPFVSRHSFRLSALLSENGARIAGAVLVLAGLVLASISQKR